MGNVLVNVRFDENGLLDLASDKVWTKVGTVNFDNDGLFGGKCAYTRKTGYFTSPVDERLVFGTKDFTISFWIKVLSYAGAGGMGVFGNSSATYGDGFATSGGYTKTCSLGFPGSNYRMTDLGLNEWRHVAIVRKDGIFNVYADGKLQNSNSDFVNTAFNLGSSAHAILTSSYSGNIGYYPFDGYLDDFVILDHALWTEDFTPPTDYLADTLSDISKPTELNLHILLDVNKTVDLTGYIHPIVPDALQLIWSSDNVSIASVDQNGKVTGNAIGITKVHVKTPDESWSAFVRIIVEEKGKNELRLSILLKPGETTILKALFQPNGTEKPVVWSSSNPAIATVGSNGKITAVAVGETIIMAQTTDGGLSDHIYVTVVADKN